MYTYMHASRNSHPHNIQNTHLSDYVKLIRTLMCYVTIIITEACGFCVYITIYIFNKYNMLNGSDG